MARQVLRLSGEEFVADPIVHVDLLEQYWAAKHNLPPDPEAEPEFPPTSHRYWRRLKEFDLPEVKTEAAEKTDAEAAVPQPVKTATPAAVPGKERP
jgi:hypothetical protein